MRRFTRGLLTGLLVGPLIAALVAISGFWPVAAISDPRGRFLSDGLEHSVIVDKSCSNGGHVPWATEKETRKPDELFGSPAEDPGSC
jgi:hypothetical protein